MCIAVRTSHCRGREKYLLMLPCRRTRFQPLLLVVAEHLFIAEHPLHRCDQR